MDGLSERQIAASLLILGGFVLAVGVMLYVGREIRKWPAGQTSAYLIWERSFVVTAVLINVLGLALLENLLRDTGGATFARIGMVTYLFGAVIVGAAETAYLSNREWVYPQIVVYVVLAFLAQAAFGVALLQTGLAAGWAGWATIIWNLAWLVGLPIVSPRDIYYPALHHAAPLLIGIALLVNG